LPVVHVGRLIFVGYRRRLKTNTLRPSQELNVDPTQPPENDPSQATPIFRESLQRDYSFRPWIPSAVEEIRREPDSFGGPPVTGGIDLFSPDGYFPTAMSPEKFFPALGLRHFFSLGEYNETGKSYPFIDPSEPPLFFSFVLLLIRGTLLGISSYQDGFTLVPEIAFGRISLFLALRPAAFRREYGFFN